MTPFNKRRSEAVAACRVNKATPKQLKLAEPVLRRQKATKDARTAVQEGNVTIVQKVLDDSKIKSDAKRKKKVKDALDAGIVGKATTEQKTTPCLDSIRKSAATKRQAKLASRVENLNDVENETSELKMVDPSNQDEMSEFIQRIEKVVTDAHEKSNLIYFCEGEVGKDRLVMRNETTGVPGYRDPNQIAVENPFLLR